MIAALLLAAAAPAAASSAVEAQRYAACLDSAGAEPRVAVAEATKWLGAGGGVPARHCLALAYLADRQYGPAALALEAAARAAEGLRDPHVAALWGQAGNAALLGGNASGALGYLTTGIAAATANPPERAQLLIDRARALVELNRLPEARADLDSATRLDPASPFGWLLRATLARRQGDLAAAEASLLEAVKRAPDDADVELEAGNIAMAQGKRALARKAWTSAAANAPGSPAAIAAADALAKNPE